MVKRYKRGTAIVLVGLIAANMTLPVLAADNISSKEEVVYAMTDANGAVQNVNVVNIFDGGDVTDYGDYSKVKMLTTTDKISQSGDEVSFDSTAEKVYYQGTLKSNEIPWNISIRYFLDGKEYTADEIAGQSGSLKMKISISKNKACSGTYYDDYALQATFLLDTDLCENIQSNGATVANVGADKQIAYTILPGKGLDTTITAKVHDFEMDAVAINGIKLNLNVDIDEDKLTDQVTELMDAIQQLDSGTTELYDGSKELKSGSSTLDSGISSLHSGVSGLDSGIETLQSGMETMQDGLNNLNSNSATLTSSSVKVKSALEEIQKQLSNVSVSTDQLSKLTEASGEIKTGIGDLSTGITNLNNNLGYAQYKALMKQNGLDIDGLKSQNQTAIDNCNSQIKELNAAIDALEAQGGQDETVAQLKEQVSTLENTVKLLTANNGAIGGTETYLNNVSAGVGELKTGADNLNTNYKNFDQSINELVTTLSGLVSQMQQLSSAINELTTQYQKLDAGINSYTEGVGSVVTGYDKMIDGVSSLASGSKKLLKGSKKLSSGSSELYDGVVALCDGAKELSEGSSELNSETSDMDTEIEDKIDEILDTIQGDETETKSFVSDKNTNVNSVQFVIKTDPVKTEETDDSAETVDNSSQTLWDKFKALFS